MSDDAGSALADTLAASLTDAGFDPNADTLTTAPGAPSAPATIDPIEETQRTGKFPETLAPQHTETPPETPPEPPKSTGVFEMIRARYGEQAAEQYAGKYQGDEQKALDALLHAQHRLSQRDEEAQWGRALKERPDQVLAALKQQRPELFEQPKPAEPAPAAPKSNGAPVLNVLEAARWMENGQIKADAPKHVVENIKEYIEYHSPAQVKLRELEAKLAALETKPNGQPNGQEVLQTVEQRLAAERGYRAAEEVVRANPWMFKEVNGQRVKTEAGWVFQNALVEAAQKGYADQDALDWAMHKVEQHNSKKPPAPAPTKQPATRKAEPSPPPPGASAEVILPGEDFTASCLRQLGLSPE